MIQCNKRQWVLLPRYFYGDFGGPARRGGGHAPVEELPRTWLVWRSAAQVKRISRLQWNDGFLPGFGPSRGDLCRRAIRPLETFETAMAMLRASRAGFGSPEQRRKSISPRGQAPRAGPPMIRIAPSPPKPSRR